MVFFFGRHDLIQHAVTNKTREDFGFELDACGDCDCLNPAAAVEADAGLAFHVESGLEVILVAAEVTA